MSIGIGCDDVILVSKRSESRWQSIDINVYNQTALLCECVCRFVARRCMSLMSVLTETVNCDSGLYVLIVLAKSNVVRMF